MTLLYFDGFEAGDIAFRYSSSGFTLSSATRFGYGSCASGSGSLAKSFTAKTEIYSGVAFNVTSNLDSTTRAWMTIFGEGGTVQQLSINVKANAVELRRGAPAGTLITTGALSSNLISNTWNHLEVYATIADSGGRCIVKINQTVVIDFTGDTKNAGLSTTIDQITIGGIGVTVNWDDWYIGDGQGAAPHNTFLGDVRVYTGVPVGEGNSTQMTPSAGQNWATQDDLPISATDYVTGEIGQKDTYPVTDLPTTVNTVYAVSLNSYVKKSDAGGASARNVCRSGTTDYVGDTTALGVSYSRLTKMYTTDPDTGLPWSRTTVNAIEAGTEVLS